MSVSTLKLIMNDRMYGLYTINTVIGTRINLFIGSANFVEVNEYDKRTANELVSLYHLLRNSWPTMFSPVPMYNNYTQYTRYSGGNVTELEEFGPFIISDHVEPYLAICNDFSCRYIMNSFNLNDSAVRFPRTYFILDDLHESLDGWMDDSS